MLPVKQFLTLIQMFNNGKSITENNAELNFSHQSWVTFILPISGQIPITPDIIQSLFSS